MPDYLEIRKYSGMSTFVSKEDRQIEVLQEARNLRFNHKLGRLVKRHGYNNEIVSSLTSLKNMVEFKNKNSQVLMMLMDGNTLEESVYSAGNYGAIGSITNDERTAGSTIDGDNFNPIIVNKELRSGAGITADTQRPIWYGYIAERDRFNGAETIAAGRYLDEQSYKDKLQTLFHANSTISEFESQVSGKGLDAGYYAVYFVPIIDGYQSSHPERFSNDSAYYIVNLVTYTDNTISMILDIDQTLSADAKRITAFDVFVAYLGTFQIDDPEDAEKFPAYFLERIDMNNDGDFFFTIEGNVGVTTANKIVIDSYADWLTFGPSFQMVYDEDNDDYYEVTSFTLDSPGAGQVTLDVTPNAAASGAATLKFFSRWLDKTTTYRYRIFYDNYYKKLGSEMYEYLNLPKGDTGITDFRYLYSANNGVFSLYGGFPNDKNFSYFSVGGSPDIVSAQNIFRHKADVRGIVAIGNDFLVFTDIGIERVTILSNGIIEQNDEYLDAILVHQKAIAKISDNEIAFMSYKGAYIISNRNVIFVGKHLNEWFVGRDANLTQAQKEACVAHYNDEHNELWFSFPTYTTSPYTAGITMVFDIEAYRGEDLSAWWFMQSDVAFKAFTTNSELHTIAGAATKFVDMSVSGSESVSTAHKLKLLQNVIPNRLVRWGWLHIDADVGDENLTVNLYFEGSASPVVLTLNSDLRGLIAYVKKTLEIEITSTATDGELEYLGMVLEFQPKVVA